MVMFFDANKYGSVFTKKALKKPAFADKYLASWRDTDGCVRHDLLYNAATNNQAEYGSLLMVLRHLLTLTSDTEQPWLEEATICGDSQLVIYQMNGKYRQSNDGIRPLYLEAMNLVLVMSQQRNPVKIRFQWVPREINNQALGLENKKTEPNEDEVTNVEGPVV